MEIYQNIENTYQYSHVKILLKMVFVFEEITLRRSASLFYIKCSVNDELKSLYKAAHAQKLGKTYKSPAKNTFESFVYFYLPPPISTPSS